MNSYHLVPDNGRWVLQAQGSKDVLGSFTTKAEGELHTAHYLHKQGGSLKIHKADGTIEEERTYPRTADPAKSPG